ETVGDKVLTANRRTGRGTAAVAVVVDGRPLVIAAVADVADLDGHVLGDRTGEAGRPVPDAADLDVGRERIDAVRSVRTDGDRVGRVRIEGCHAQAARLRQQDRP